MICDNYGTHKHQRQGMVSQTPAVSRLHPTSSSWLNLVERWFRDLTDKAIRRGVFHSVNDLITAIEDYLEANNGNPKPFVWTATADQILAKVAADEKSEKKEKLGTAKAGKGFAISPFATTRLGG